jgi:small subunit ribosomal protein S18
MSAFVTEMGKIKPRSVTNLTWRSQRKLGKAIRRAKMMGIIPQLSRKLLAQTNTAGRFNRRNW